MKAPRLNPSQPGQYSIYLPQRDGRLSWPRWLTTYWDSLPVCRQSSVQVVTVWSNFDCYLVTWSHTRTHVANLLMLCLEWYNGSITPRVHSGVTKVPNKCSVATLPTVGSLSDNGISVLNHCLECMFPEYIYWQGLDSLCAPFLYLNFNNESLHHLLILTCIYFVLVFLQHVSTVSCASTVIAVVSMFVCNTLIPLQTVV